jgi:release factor glutamine methyltransferase
LLARRCAARTLSRAAEEGEGGAVTVREALARCSLVPLDARVLLAHVLGVDRAWLVAHDDDVLSPHQLAAFDALASRRRAGEPVAYLTGLREFWDLPLAVDASVLIPRPETETLVEQALYTLRGKRDPMVLDLGTGSGAIALAIAHERADATVDAVDISSQALAVARRNADRLKLANLRFIQSDWYAALPPGRIYDLIAGNPPYVREADPHLSEGDVRFEPKAALRAGADGLDGLRAVIGGARARLAPGGALVVEHGFDQRDAVRALMADAGFVPISTHRDLAGVDRVSLAKTSDSR